MRLGFAAFAVLVVASTSVALSFSACSNTDPRPDAGDTNSPGVTSSSGGSSTSSSGSVGKDGSASDGGGEGGDAGLPSSCADTIKDDVETDVDCGGNVCAKCFDGKACIANTDCAGGACLNKICITPKCTDNSTNGDETDTDCGGSVCPRCTIGKRCGQGSDCVSGACVNQQCACPAGMTTASKAGGNGAYCIDETEVTKFEYNKFLTANVNINDQVSVCKPPSNGTFVPRGAWPPAAAPPYNLQPGEGLAFNYSLPVHYVDWCDAYAYCKWAGKQLCGAVGGGSVPPALADQADASAWYNACSAQGTKPWPYGTIYDDNPYRCNGYGFNQDAGPIKNNFGGYGFGGANQDDGVYQLNNGDINGKYTLVYFGACQGGVTGLYQMSGNVAEWEDSCDGANPDSLCRVRGGSFAAYEDAGTMSCLGYRVEQRMPPAPADADQDVLRDIGFRCCLY